MEYEHMRVALLAYGWTEWPDGRWGKPHPELGKGYWEFIGPMIKAYDYLVRTVTRKDGSDTLVPENLII